MSQQLKAHFPIFALVPFQIQLSWQHLSFSATCHPQAASGPYLFQLSDLRCQLLYIIASALPVIPPWKWRPGAQSSFLTLCSTFCFSKHFHPHYLTRLCRQLRASMPFYSQGLVCSVTYQVMAKPPIASSQPHQLVLTPACSHLFLVSTLVKWVDYYYFKVVICLHPWLQLKVLNMTGWCFFLSKPFLCLKNLEDLKTCFKLSPKNVWSSC